MSNMSKQKITIVVWDNIGNVLLGVKIGGDHANEWRKDLVQSDPAAIEAAPTFDELFADYDTNVIEVHTLDELDKVIAEADYLVVHKERVPAEVLAKGKKIKLIQHLGLDYRGVPIETVRAMGIPVCATPLIN